MLTTGRNRIRGSQGETLAAAFLTARGWRVLARNLKIGRLGEIDLLMHDGHEVVLVEVKAQTAGRGFDPSDKVDFQKRRKLAQLAQVIAARYPERDIRVDAIAITALLGQAPGICHYPNILEEL